MSHIPVLTQLLARLPTPDGVKMMRAESMKVLCAAKGARKATVRSLSKRLKIKGKPMRSRFTEPLLQPIMVTASTTSYFDSKGKMTSSSVVDDMLGPAGSPTVVVKTQAYLAPVTAITTADPGQLRCGTAVADQFRVLKRGFGLQPLGSHSRQSMAVKAKAPPLLGPYKGAPIFLDRFCAYLQWLSGY